MHGLHQVLTFFIHLNHLFLSLFIYWLCYIIKLIVYNKIVMLYLLLLNWEIYLYFLCLQVSNKLQLESHNRCQELDLIAWKLTTSSLFATPLHHSQLGSTQANHFALFFNDRPPIYSHNPCRKFVFRCKFYNQFKFS